MTDEQPTSQESVVDEVTRDLMEQGKIVEAGWTGLRMLSIPDEVSDIQIQEMRFAFFSGAQYALSNMVTAVHLGEEPTVEDIARMSMMHFELQAFAQDIQMQLQQALGNS